MKGLKKPIATHSRIIVQKSFIHQNERQVIQVNWVGQIVVVANNNNCKQSFEISLIKRRFDGYITYHFQATKIAYFKVFQFESQI